MSLSLNNGILVRDSQYNPMGIHFDRAHLSQISPTKPTDLGVIDLWVQTQKKETPLYSMSSFGGKNTIYTEGHKFEWRIPTQSVQPYIVDSYLPADEEKIGQDGETFQIKINNRYFGHGAIISYDKYNGAEFFVTSDDIINAGDGFIYTVKLVNNSNFKFVDAKFLQPNTYLFRKGSSRDEHSTDWDDFLLGEAGYRKFFNYVGEAKAHAHYSVSEDAAVMGASKDVVELWKLADNADPNLKAVKSVSELAGKVGGSKGMKKMIYDGELSYSWTRKLDVACFNKISADVETYLMWGNGGFIRTTSGPNDTRMPVGLWKQLDNGYKHVYTRDEFTYEMFRAEIYNYFNGKVDWDGPQSKRKLVIQTGLGGMELINNMIMRAVRGAGLQLNATEMGVLSGDRMGLEWGMFADKIKMPFLADLEFVYNAAFDNVHNNPIENPTVEGYPLSSYSFVVFDYNTDQGSDNIVLLKYAPNNNYAESDIKWFVQNGTADYYGKRSGFQSSGDFSGYKAKFSMRYPTLFVKDPTKILRFSMLNPVTGGSL